ncbi:MAG: hypothetical protein CMJ18_00435 [Phycisphaeraceae bacterium]|nr:hypothetical protein [Phycisphaeraceae bacterium]
MRTIHNMPVIPEEGEHYAQCAHKPMTRSEMKCDFRNAMFMKHPDSQACWEAILRYKVASAVYFHARHWISEKDGTEWFGWKHSLRKLADAGVFIFHVNPVWLGAQRTRAYFDFLVETFGEQFIGMKGDSELDGGYTAGWCWTGSYAEQMGKVEVPSPRRSRAEARQQYDEVLDWFYGRAFNRGMSISSLGYGCHYAAEHGARMLGIEAEECLPSDTLLWCFCRGAAKQYDLLTTVSISSVNHWGLGPHFRDGENVAFGDEIVGPDYGASQGLHKREWYVAYMNSASIIVFADGIFHHAKYAGKISGDYEPFIKGGGANPPGFGYLEANLTPKGKTQLQCQEFAAEHPVRGTPYMPVALLLDHDHGWNPPGDYYRTPTDCVWGNIPYARGDYQIDNFFRWVYPDYELASYYRDERGYITNTPFGDLFEVIVSNASPTCLDKYRVVMLLGEQQVAEDVQQRLADFARNGGIVVVAIDQWPQIGSDLAGAEVGEGVPGCEGDVRAADDVSFSEERFEYREAGVTTGDVLLATRDGAPLVIRNPVGEGAFFLVTVPSWGRTEKRHEILSGIRHVLGNLLRDLRLVEVKGRPIYCLVNVTDRDDELIVTLCNNSPDLPWEGSVRLVGAPIASFEAWLGHSEAAIEDGALRCGVPANDVRIFKLGADRSFLPLMFRDIDWKKLGVGIPDTDFQTCPARRNAHQPGHG